MIEDVLNIDLMEICCQVGFMILKLINSFIEIINDCMYDY